MFSESFYPTPLSLCEYAFGKYIDTIKANKSNVLEPSAGKGDIASFVRYRTSKYIKIDMVEKDESLAKLASSYGTIVGDDFLDFTADKNYDFIFMNPPFANGDEHLLHAYSIARNTTIVCILNAETIRNSFSKKRKALMNILDGVTGGISPEGFSYSSAPASIEFINNAFSGSDSERKTGVEIAVVTIVKKTSIPNGDMFDSVNFETESERSDSSFDFDKETGVVTRDSIKNIVLDFNRSVLFFEEGQKLIAKARSISSVYTNNMEGFRGGSIREVVQEFEDSLRGKVWSMILSKINIQKYMTGSVLTSFMQKMDSQKKISITEKNISIFIATILQNSSDILETSIVSVFENITKYHKENRYEPEGWAHNETYMVGKKFVLPYIMETDKWDGKFSKLYRHGRVLVLDDIDKALCYLTGNNYDTCNTIIDSINSAISELETKCQSEFFDIVFYKKGTVHFTFRSPKVWADFNMRATKGKGWLPASMEGKWRQKNAFK